jgi:antitoxin HicB
LPELVTEGDTIDEALSNVHDALAALIEAYQDLNRSLPSVLRQVVLDASTTFWIETVVTA